MRNTAIHCLKNNFGNIGKTKFFLTRCGFAEERLAYPEEIWARDFTFVFS